MVAVSASSVACSTQQAYYAVQQDGLVVQGTPNTEAVSKSMSQLHTTTVNKSCHLHNT